MDEAADDPYTPSAGVTLTFLGAAGTVTGSKFLLEAVGRRVLVDCGLFQGEREWRRRNWDTFPVDPSTVDAVVVTHAHLDHCGYLPVLTRHGFRGPVYCSADSARLIPIVLRDAAYLQEEDARRAAQFGTSRHEPPVPLFDTGDAEKAIGLLQPAARGRPYEAAAGFTVSFHRAGHILGASFVRVEVAGAGTRGRALADGATEVKIHGRYVPVRAEIANIRGFSAHADADQLLQWMRGGSVRRTTFVVHGEPQAAATLADRVRRELERSAVVPRYGERVRLD